MEHVNEEIAMNKEKQGNSGGTFENETYKKYIIESMIEIMYVYLCVENLKIYDLIMETKTERQSVGSREVFSIYNSSINVTTYTANKKIYSKYCYKVDDREFLNLDTYSEIYYNLSIITSYLYVLANIMIKLCAKQVEPLMALTLAATTLIQSVIYYYYRNG